MDRLYATAMELEFPELLKRCNSNKDYNDICNNDNFWGNRLRRDYPDYQEFNSETFSINSLSLKEAYFFLYQLTWIKKLLNTDESEYDIFLKEELYLIGKGLTKVPSFNLPNLKKLDLSLNGLKEVPSFDLPQLQALYLDYNNLTEVPSFSLPKLQVLILHHNQLAKVPSFNLPKLKSLNLGNNQLVKVPPFNLPKLETLVLNNNQLTEIPPFNLPKLQNLYLDNNKLSEIWELIFPNLQRLDLSHNKLTRLPALHLYLPKLENFDLRYNQLTRIPIGTFSDELPRLKILYLDGNNFSKDTIKEIKSEFKNRVAIRNE